MPLTHARAPAQNQSLAPPDYWVSEATAWNYKIASEEKTYKLHDDQATSIRMYAESLGEHVFYYKEQVSVPDGKGGFKVRAPFVARAPPPPPPPPPPAYHLPTDAKSATQVTQPFVIGLCNRAQKAMFREYGHRGTLHMDETFGARSLYMSVGVCANHCSCLVRTQAPITSASRCVLSWSRTKQTTECR